MSLSKHQIFASKDLKETFVDMPEWGGKVKIKALSTQEQLDFDEFISSKPSEVDMSIFLIRLGCVDDNNNKLFDKDDEKHLKQKSSTNLFKLVDAILSLNKQKPNDLEDMAKNS